MSEDNVIDLLKKAEQINVDVWLDGGWGVDALLGQQTRPHNDIDIFIQRKDTYRERYTRCTVALQGFWTVNPERI
jgi:lincosamide nucleotidyltransferase A/C/D/E